jgi:hypothetical protein
MKFTVDVFGLIFLLLIVKGSSMQAMSKPQEAVHSTTLGKSAAVAKVVHMSAQSTIPTKIAHAHAAPTKLKVPMASLTGIKQSDGEHRPSAKQLAKKSKELRKVVNKSNHWGLAVAEAIATAGNHTNVAHAHALKSKSRTVSSTKPTNTTAGNHTKEVHVQPSVPKTVNVNASHDAAAKAKLEKPKTLDHKVTNASTPKAVTKEVKAAKAIAPNKTASHAAAVVKAAPNMPHVLVKATTKSSSQAKTGSASRSTAAIAAQNLAEHKLLNFLASENDKKELPPFDVYLPACLDHLHGLVDSLDSAYTDVQLHAVLVDECWLKKSFPESHDSSFSTDAACKKFATSLVNARYLELQMGSQEGYEGFCADYYVHIGGDLGKKKAEAPPPPKKRSRTPFPWHFVVVAAVILILFAIIVCMVVFKKQESPGPDSSRAVDYS